jgi:inactivated superfamily I helicase
MREITNDHLLLIKKIKQYTINEFSSEEKNWIHSKELNENELFLAWQLTCMGLAEMYPNKESIIKIF